MLVQEGHGNSATLLQSGYGNVATQIQRGSGNVMDVVQQGNGNSLHFEQNGTASAIRRSCRRGAPMSRSSRATRRPALSRAAALLAAGCAAAFPILPMTAMANEMARSE